MEIKEKRKEWPKELICKRMAPFDLKHDSYTPSKKINRSERSKILVGAFESKTWLQISRGNYVTPRDTVIAFHGVSNLPHFDGSNPCLKA